jgi:sugar/nucleoside kinase (ribokinase family)
VLGARSRRDGIEVVEARKPSSFDVVCAGEAHWDLEAPRGAGAASAGSLRFRAGGAAVNAALSLAQRGLRVGLAAALADDAFGRALHAKVATAGVYVGGVVLGPPRAGLVVVEAAGSAQRVVAREAEDALPVAVPEAWAAQVLLLTGLAPALPYAAGLCKAARAARRVGSIIVVDVNARRRRWAGRDPRVIHAMLREADVVRCSTEDLAALGIDAAAMRAEMRRNATLVLTDGAAAARAVGPFGEVVKAPRVVAAAGSAGAGDAFTAALCAELARTGDHGADRIDRWDRMLQRGHDAARALLQRR